jgi:DNA polymerase III epsilon subunit-like protein
MRFSCIDVETANENMSSICQVGIVTYLDDEVVSESDFEAILV